MKVTLLGTGSPIPHPFRAGPATLVQAGTDSVLVDAGRGVIMRLAQAGLVPTMLSGVVLTHLHSDHVCDLNDIITTHWVMSPSPTPLRIVGPRGTQDFVDRTIAALHADVSYRIAHHADLDDGPWVDVHEVGPGDELTVGSLALTVGSTDHRPVEPSVGYRFEHEGASVAVAGDGVPCDTLDALTRGATAYVQTVIRDDIVRQVPNARLQDILDYHSTVGQAAATASRAGVRYLILTHYVPAPAPGTEQEWRDLAVGFTGEVIVGDDLTSVEFTA